MNEPTSLYILSFVSALILSLILTPAARAAALVLDIIDHPHSSVKTHKEPIPYLGGAAIFLAFSLTLLWVRVLTNFPTGTLRSLRGILLGGFIVFSLGLTDDIKLRGLHYRTKFIFQFMAAGIVMFFGVHMKFIEPMWLGLVLSAFWIVGITNAVNLIDIMDGLASGTIAVAGLAFLFISLPTEDIYVNFAAAALAGAALGFLPFNLSKGLKIFMGDSGSLFLGFMASSLALGTNYTSTNDISMFAPLLILAIPIYDTAAVFVHRIRQGISPFLGSKDHFPLRMEILGWKRNSILGATLLGAVLLSLAAFGVTITSYWSAVAIYSTVIVSLLLFTLYVMKAKVK